MPLGAARFGLLGGIADLGKLELIETQTFSTVSTVTFTSIQESTYNVHFLSLVLTGSHQDHRLDISFSNDGGSTYENSNYQYAKQFGQTDGTFNQQTSTSATLGIQMGANMDSNRGWNAYAYLYNLGNSSKFSFVTNQSIGSRSGDAGVNKMEFGSGVYTVAETINAFKFAGNVGTLTGVCSLYGIAES
jgi:hypothetical protein